MKKQLYLLVIAAILALGMIVPAIAQETTDPTAVPDSLFDIPSVSTDITVPTYANSLGVADPFALPSISTDVTVPTWANSLGVADPFALPSISTDVTVPTWANSLGVEDPFAIPSVLYF
jgi:hypothetical protein